MSDQRFETERQMLLAAEERGGAGKLTTYLRLSGPGWLQSALTLGGGSLGSSLYLGILAGTSLLWLQPFAMVLGVIMLSAISYVTLSTNERPLQAINRHINPVLGWSWVAATLMANMVWVLPQYSLCFAVCEQNLLPSIFLGDGPLSDGTQASDAGKWLVSFVALAICTVVTWSYGSGSWGVRLYEIVLKLVVALIVVSFAGVVLRMASVEPGLDWGAVLAGFVPKPQHLYEPSATFAPLLEAVTDPAARSYWSDLIVSQQRDVMLSAGAAAVGINMTFLLPYSLLSRGWDRAFRGLTIFDLSTGTFIPFVIATCCVVIASAQQFHTQIPDGFVVSEENVEPPPQFEKAFSKNLKNRDDAAEEYGIAGAPGVAEERLAAVLCKRDTLDLAKSLQTLFADEDSDGRVFSNIVFGIGVVGMTLSSISLMMLISGFVVCEVLGEPTEGWVFRGGCMLASVGVLWPLVWGDGDAKAYLTVVAGVFGSMLLPIAYVTFFVMMNQRSLLGDQLPTGGRRVLWNVLMGLAATAASAAGVSAIMKKAGNAGLVVVGLYLALVIAVQLTREEPEAAD
ncbi:MAG: divalent metal cation transporter [Planctomycetota bacterium]